MQDSSTPRRAQFSSCDACRLSRVACDASKLGHQPGQTGSGWTGSCSRCLWRSQKCTFEWIKNSSSKRRKDSKSRSTPTSTTAGSFASCESPGHNAFVMGLEPSNGREESYNPYNAQSPRAPSSEHFVLEPEPKSTDAPSSNVESVDVLLTRWDEQIFNHGFEAIWGHWIGRNGCPCVNDPTSDISIAPMKLFGELDACLDKQPAFAVAAQRPERNDQIEQSLRRAVQSFAARWLPLVIQGKPDIQYEEVIRERWRATRKDMLKVIHRTSYRSVLTLYLFGQTPVPVGIPEEEELDGISGIVCTQTALLQLQQLRERLRSCQFDGSGISAWSDAVTSSAASPDLTQAFLNLESRAYWAAVTWDTSNSVTLNFRSSLSSGLKGACLEPAWRLTRGFLVGSFHARTEDWRNKAFEVSDETAPQIISAVGICSTYTWRTIASLKEALREGVEDSDVLVAWDAFLDARDIFKTTIHPLLSICERRLHFLSQVERLNWYEVVLHYHLGILLLVDAVEAGNRLDILSQLTETRLEAEQESFNVLKFGLESDYIIYGPPEALDNASGVDSTAHSPRQLITTSFVALDPWPHHVVALVRLMKKAISRRYRQGNIKNETYSYLSSTLIKALQQLPQSSKTVQSALENLKKSLRLDVISAGDA